MLCSWPATPLEDDDLLQEILLRLPPQQCSLPRASAVCTRWLGLVTDPKFIARFRDHHGKPPLLGVFHRSRQGIVFTPLLDPPPTLRFDLGRYKDYDVLSCRHGRLLAVNHPRDTILLVCDPITGKQCRMAVPRVFREFNNRHSYITGSVLCADRAQCRLHGGCHSGHFKVVLMARKDDRPILLVYSSKNRTWGKIISTAAPCDRLNDSGTLVGNALYWSGIAKDMQHMLVLDLDEHSLAVITGPPITSEFRYGDSQIIRAEDGAVGLVILSYHRFGMWRRNVNCHGVATWEIWKTIDMHNNISGIPRTDKDYIKLGYCEDTDAFFIHVERGVYMVHLKSMQSKRIHSTKYDNWYHPFSSFYTPGE